MEKRLRRKLSKKSDSSFLSAVDESMLDDLKVGSKVEAKYQGRCGHDKTTSIMNLTT